MYVPYEHKCVPRYCAKGIRNNSEHFAWDSDDDDYVTGNLGRVQLFISSSTGKGL